VISKTLCACKWRSLTILSKTYNQNKSTRIPQLNGKSWSKEQTFRSEDNAFCL
jgi:hypothetical protein